MSLIEPARQFSNSPIPAEATLRRIQFVEQSADGQEVLLDFIDPVHHQAICLVAERDSLNAKGTAAAADGIDILTVSGQASDHLAMNDELLKWVAESALPGTSPIAITIHGAQVIWQRSRAAIQASPERTTPFLLALIDFSYHENELRKLEREIAENWPLLALDSPLAYHVAAANSEQFEEVGQRMEQTLSRRIRLARLVPHLYQPRVHLSPLANQLMERLRERTCVEERHEALVSQLEVFERIYEMNSQRISDFRAARQERTLEWIIIVLLATETLFLFLHLLWALDV